MSRNLLPALDAPVSRRRFLRFGGAVGTLAGLDSLVPAYARPGRGDLASHDPEVLDGRSGPVDIFIEKTRVRIDGREASAVTMNGSLPGPLLRLQEGGEAVMRVHNRLDEDTSIHWHGLIVPNAMDGVPKVNFPGIRPGEVFEYRFPVGQNGTYWFHSHSGLQEQLGHYGSIVIDPAGADPVQADRDYVVVLSDWTFENPYRLMARLKKRPDYYNRQKRTLGDFLEDAAEQGFGAALQDRLMWGAMRMNPTDISDVTGATLTYLMNGLPTSGNWTGLFEPGQRVRLRFVNAAAATIFDVRVPGLPLTVVQKDGQYVKPVETDEFRIGTAETYDVIVEPHHAGAFTVFAEAMDRSGFVRGTLATQAGMEAAVPPRRPRPLLTMDDMGMDHGGMGHEGMDHGGMDHGPQPTDTAHAGHATPTDTAHAGHVMPADTTNAHAAHPVASDTAHAGHAMAADTVDVHAGHDNMPAPDPHAGHRMEGTMLRAPGTVPETTDHAPDSHGPGNASIPERTRSRLNEPGVGLGRDGWRVLTYADLEALEPAHHLEAPTREVEIHLTGNMERFMWSIDGKKFSEAEPIRLGHGERIRLTMVNDTMMTHPMHLHGMWMELENGKGTAIPKIHTVNVQPAERISMLVTADAPGPWAFHCHILYHMDAGMFRVVQVGDHPTVADAAGHSGGHS